MFKISDKFPVVFLWHFEDIISRGYDFGLKRQRHEILNFFSSLFQTTSSCPVDSPQNNLNFFDFFAEIFYLDSQMCVVDTRAGSKDCPFKIITGLRINSPVPRVTYTRESELSGVTLFWSNNSVKV